MKTIIELKNALKNKKHLVWNDPEPIEGNDYTITWIEDLTDINDKEDMRGYPILIQYSGSEAQVFLHEILIK